jgi:hypothetical protein
VKEDTIEPTHALLVASERWETCLSCHDFHGNHIRTTPTRLEDGAAEAAVARYLAGGQDVYGSEVRFPARDFRLDQ